MPRTVGRDGDLVGVRPTDAEHDPSQYGATRCARLARLEIGSHRVVQTRPREAEVPLAGVAVAHAACTRPNLTAWDTSTQWKAELLHGRCETSGWPAHGGEQDAARHGISICAQSRHIGECNSQLLGPVSHATTPLR
eukprot:scaffold168025_cov39-Tisochrysis_lutea.AAC.3